MRMKSPAYPGARSGWAGWWLFFGYPSRHPWVGTQKAHPGAPTAPTSFPSRWPCAARCSSSSRRCSSLPWQNTTGVRGRPASTRALTRRPLTPDPPNHRRAHANITLTTLLRAGPRHFGGLGGGSLRHPRLRRRPCVSLPPSQPANHTVTVRRIWLGHLVRPSG